MGMSRTSSQQTDPRGFEGAEPRTGQRGFTVLELLMVVAIVGILAMIATPYLEGRIEKARLARCMNNLRSIQTTVYTHSDGWELPNPNTFWSTAWSDKKPGKYQYLVDSQDANKGHGNDLDQLGWYVYIEDMGPPLIATYNNNPGYHRFIGRGDKGGGGGGDKPDDDKPGGGKPDKPPK